MTFRLSSVLCVLGLFLLPAPGCDEFDCSTIPGFCDDGRFCNGEETCQDGACVAGTLPCVDENHCDEDFDTCQECVEDSECDNAVFCDGTERCNNGTCEDSILPCPGGCDEASTSCSGKCNRSDCDDGIFCNGEESCRRPPEGSFDVCLPGDFPCPTQICLEDEQVCVACVTDDDCPGDDVCDDGTCQGSDTADPQAIFITLRNNSSGLAHILTAQDSFGPTNRLDPNATRTVTTGAVPVGEQFSFRVGANGQVFQTVECTFQTPADPDAAQAEVVWSGTTLSCTGDLN